MVSAGGLSSAGTQVPQKVCSTRSLGFGQLGLVLECGLILEGFDSTASNSSNGAKSSLSTAGAVGPGLDILRPIDDQVLAAVTTDRSDAAL